MARILELWDRGCNAPLMTQARYDKDEIQQFALNLLLASGMELEKAKVVCEILVEGDLMGHTTHGLQMLIPYLKSIEAKTMTLSGTYSILRETPSHLVMDGRFLPGPWLVCEALDWAAGRIQGQGVVSMCITQSHHIAALQAYLPRATQHGWILSIMSSDPSVATVAAFGGKTPLFTPNPMAVGIPGSKGPILFDFCTSITSNGQCMRSQKEGQILPGEWVQDANGKPTNDPGALFTDPPGTIYPLGGPSYGHKGFALGLWVEIMTSALAGHGRSQKPTQWGASVFLQVIDPASFGGKEAFLREVDYLIQSCRESEPVDPAQPVRLPGEAAWKKRNHQLTHGVVLHEGILPGLSEWSKKWNISMPEPLH